MNHRRFIGNRGFKVRIALQSELHLMAYASDPFPTKSFARFCQAAEPSLIYFSLPAFFSFLSCYITSDFMDKVASNPGLPPVKNLSHRLWSD